jgi:hypothetical protein
MTVLINLTSRDPDLFYWPKPNWHGKPAELLRVESKIEDLWECYGKKCDIIPLPNIELDELLDEIDHLEKIKTRLWNEWQHLETEKERNEQVRINSESISSLI